MRCKNCFKNFTVKYFGDKHCDSEECKEAKQNYQNGKRNSSTFGNKKGTELKRTPIKKVSIKLKENTKIYNKVRKQYLLDNPKCEKCNNSDSIEIHHTNSRTGDRLIDTFYFMAICRPCHLYVHENPEESRKKGWLKTID